LRGSGHKGEPVFYALMAYNFGKEITVFEDYFRKL
jgi:hypothetical protein